MKYVSVQEMIAIEKEADAKGHTYSQMMEFAGRGLAEVIQDVYDHIRQKEVLGLVGSGNNGGDALVAFCYLQDWGWQTTAYIVRQRPENDPLVKRFLKAGGRLLNTADDPDFRELKSQLDASSLLVDAVLGTGIRLPLRGDIPEVLSIVGRQLQLMEHPLPILAVDCPSG